MDTLTLLGLFAVTAMIVYMPWNVAATGSCWPSLEPAHGIEQWFLQGAWPFGVVDRHPASGDKRLSFDFS
jgi:hypothetical protein